MGDATGSCDPDPPSDDGAADEGASAGDDPKVVGATEGGMATPDGASDEGNGGCMGASVLGFLWC